MVKQITFLLISVILSFNAWATTYTVINNADAGAGSLRDAILSADGNIGPDLINFSSSMTIILSTPLAVYDSFTVIDGSGWNVILRANAGFIGQSMIDIWRTHVVVKDITLDGIGFAQIGLFFENWWGNYRKAENLTIINFTAAGINTDGAVGDTVLNCLVSGNGTLGIAAWKSWVIMGNKVGTDATGMAPFAGPLQRHGIMVWGDNTIIGGTSVGQGNVISGNDSLGILIDSASFCFVMGNKIGVDATGLNPIPNGWHGIEARNLSNFLKIGDGSSASANIIGANGGEGILLQGVSSMGPFNCSIDNNLIGIGSDRSKPLPNNFNGIAMIGGPNYAYVTNNLIAYNVGIGISYNGLTTLKNQVYDNSIYNNGGGVTSFGGAQETVWAPIIDSLSIDSTLYGKASPNALIQIYADSMNQGQFFLDTTMSDALGNWQKRLTAGIPYGLNITAIQDSAGNSSQFSWDYWGYLIDGMVYNQTMADSIESGWVYIYQYESIAKPFKLIQKEWIGVDSQWGEYSFYGLPGKYVLLAAPSPIAYPAIIPTYYGDKVLRSYIFKN